MLRDDAGTPARIDDADAVAPRHAVYFAPAPEHPLWQAGCAWLGRDARVLPAPPPARAEVASPWRYGWHATLKAPMRLAPDRDESGWLHAVRSLAAGHAPFDMPPLEVARLADFLALRPVRSPAARHPLRRLADACVLRLDLWRAVPTPAERGRQLRPGMSERQRRNVEHFGYAHVFEDWRFHMTLSGSLATLDDSRIAQLHEAARRHFADALREPLRCDALCVFVEPSPGAPFELRHRFALGGA
jgi:hypothetical protein